MKTELKKQINSNRQAQDTLPDGRTENTPLRCNTWCFLPWLHLFINPQGRVKPCCHFKMDDVWEIKVDPNKKNNLSKIFLNSSMGTSSVASMPQ